MYKGGALYIKIKQFGPKYYGHSLPHQFALAGEDTRFQNGGGGGGGPGNC